MMVNIFVCWSKLTVGLTNMIATKQTWDEENAELRIEHFFLTCYLQFTNYFSFPQKSRKLFLYIDI